MTLQQLQIIFYGLSAVVLLLGFYALYEWGLYLLGQLRAGRLKLNKAHVLFGLPSAGLSLLPFTLVVVAMHLQPFGGVVLFAPDDGNTVVLMFMAFFVGFALQGLAAALFWYFSRRYKDASGSSQ